MDIETTLEDQRTGLGRRRVLKATAWSMPVIAVAVAAPAAAASGDGALVAMNLAQTGVSTAVVGTAGIIDRSLVEVVGASSAQDAAGNEAAKANDGNAGTWWHTAWGPVPAGPHWIALEGPESYELTGLQYTPRPAGDPVSGGTLNGVANAWYIDGSADASFASPVELARGTWGRDNTTKTATFSNPSRLRYVRFYVESQHGNGDPDSAASAAEIRLVGAPVVLTSLEGTSSFSSDASNVAAITGATLNMTVPASGLSTALAPDVSGAGWSFDAMSPSGADLIFTFNFSGSVAPGGTSTTLAYSLQGDSTTATTVALPKTATGTLTGPQIATVTSTATWS